MSIAPTPLGLGGVVDEEVGGCWRWIAAGPREWASCLGLLAVWAGQLVFRCSAGAKAPGLLLRRRPKGMCCQACPCTEGDKLYTKWAACSTHAFIHRGRHNVVVLWGRALWPSEMTTTAI